MCYNEGVYTWTWLEEWFIEHYLTTQDFCAQLDQPIDFRLEEKFDVSVLLANFDLHCLCIL